MGSIYKIPAKDSFIDNLALGLLNNADYYNILDKLLIILPNNISCKFLYDSLLKHFNHRLSLPKIIPIADLSTIDDPFRIMSDFVLLPAPLEIDDMKIFILKNFHEWSKNNIDKSSIKSLDKTEFCHSFLKLFLELEEMECNINDLLNKIIISDFSIYNQLLIKFLDYFKDKWDLYKKDSSKISFIEYRNNVVNLRAKFLSQIRGFSKVMLAGTTGVNQCTQNLIQEIIKSDKGVFVFHDMIPLSTNITDILPNHPNYLNISLNNLLGNKARIWHEQQTDKNIIAIKDHKPIQRYIEADNIYQESQLIYEIIIANRKDNQYSTVITNNIYLRNLILTKLLNYSDFQIAINQQNNINLLYISILKLIIYFSEENNSKQILISFFKQYYNFDNNEFESFLTSFTKITNKFNATKWINSLITKFSLFLINNTTLFLQSELDNQCNKVRLLAHNDIIEFKKNLEFLIIKDSNIFYENEYLTIIHPKDARLKHFTNSIIGDVSEDSWLPGNNDIFNTVNFLTILNVHLRSLREGQIANDFLRHKYSNNVTITKSKFIGKKDNISYFWLKEFLNKNSEYIYYNNIKSIPYKADSNNKIIVKPDKKYRIHDFSVTQIEKLIRNPYSIYALKILKLKASHQFDFEQEAQFFGIMIHEVIDKYIHHYDSLNLSDHLQYLLSLFAQKIKNSNFRKSIIKSWQSRFYYISSWIIQQHRKAIKNSIKIYSEYNVKIPIKHIYLKAKIDRIEEYHNQLKIIDYKTGKPPSVNNITLGLSPQLILEAYICLKLFNNLKSEDILLEYWELKGKKLKDGIINIIKDQSELIKYTEQYMLQIISDYQNNNTPIISFPNDNHISEYDDYFHLARQNKIK